MFYSLHHLHFNSNTNINKKIKNCSWRNKETTFYYDRRRKIYCQESIKFLNSLNMKYFLIYGSALGAARNKGLIKRDNDIDVAVPIWLNPHIFNCNKFEKVNNSNNDIDILINNKYKICGYNKKYYMYVLAEYINKLKSVKYIIDFPNLHIRLFDNLLIDIWIYMTNEGVYRDISICKCDFCGIESYALEKSIEYSKIYYGNDCMKVVKNSKGKPHIFFDNPNKKHIYSKIEIFFKNLNKKIKKMMN